MITNIKNRRCSNTTITTSTTSLLLSLLLFSILGTHTSSWCMNSRSSRSTPSRLASEQEGRREFLDGAITAAIIGTASFSLFPCQTSNAVDELPAFVRPYTALAPLGKPLSSDNNNNNKSKNLSLNELASRLSQDLTTGATGKGGYFVTGDISTDIFRDDCVFVDPTNQAEGLNRYRNALRILFDPESSSVELIRPVVPVGVGQLKTSVRSRGYLQLPWRPYVSSYESDIVYTIDDDGLIVRQEQTWSKSATQALRETFTPTLFSPPPKSKIPKPSVAVEPETVTRLFEKTNGRRPGDYSPIERIEIDQLIDTIVNQQQQQYHNAWKPNDLPGKWMLVYLQPGPDGRGVDRRIPFFPEFGFNDSYQVFGDNKDTVNNIGEVFGPLLQVRVGGSLREVVPGNNDTPKRLEANIEGGGICLELPTAKNNNAVAVAATATATTIDRDRDRDFCIPLPIQGQGLFDGVYLSPRLRIGQNLNGSGARIVQVRIQ